MTITAALADIVFENKKAFSAQRKDCGYNGINTYMCYYQC